MKGEYRFTPMFKWETHLQLGVLMATLEAVFQPIREQSRPMMRQKAQQLKETDGEGWAVGEMLERACIMLDALEAERQE